jgi:hypothetical protein
VLAAMCEYVHQRLPISEFADSQQRNVGAAVYVLAHTDGIISNWLFLKVKDFTKSKSKVIKCLFVLLDTIAKKWIDESCHAEDPITIQVINWKLRVTRSFRQLYRQWIHEKNVENMAE